MTPEQQQAAIRQALELLAVATFYSPELQAKRTEAINAGFEALRSGTDVEQQPAVSDEPVAWMCADEELARKGYSRFSQSKEGAWNIPVYTHPPQRTEPEQEPVAYQLRHPNVNFGNWYTVDMDRHRRATKDFERRELVVASRQTNPPQRKQPADEPVAWQGIHDTTDLYWRKPVQGDVRPLYTAPPQREWQGLTDEEITALKRNGERYVSSQDFARAIEAKLKEKNT